MGERVRVRCSLHTISFVWCCYYCFFFFFWLLMLLLLLFRIIVLFEIHEIKPINYRSLFDSHNLNISCTHAEPRSCACEGDRKAHAPDLRFVHWLSNYYFIVIVTSIMIFDFIYHIFFLDHWFSVLYARTHAPLITPCIFERSNIVQYGNVSNTNKNETTSASAHHRRLCRSNCRLLCEVRVTTCVCAQSDFVDNCNVRSSFCYFTERKSI